MDEPFDIRITSGSPTAEEVAALTAVLRGVIDELAAGEARRIKPSTTAWQRAQRPLRTPTTPGPGHWRGFSG